MEPVRIRGARQHNLQGVDLELPRPALVAITGPSGSGKSSLAFDTLFAEGQRRYIESLSTYAKQFLERMPKPAVESIDHLPPALALEQHNPVRTSRSTVGTASEVHDLLRLLWARVGTLHCPRCDRAIAPETADGVAARLRARAGARVRVLFPVPPTVVREPGSLGAHLRALGFLRVEANGATWRLDEPLPPAVVAAPDLAVVVDRLTLAEEAESRLREALETAFTEGDGEAWVRFEDGTTWRFAAAARCPAHPDVRFPAVTPQLFSFHNPAGSCPTCTGFGAVLAYDESLVVPNPERSLAEGAIDPWTKPRYELRRRALLAFARRLGVDPRAPWRALPAEARQAILHGAPGFEGVFPFLRALEEKRYKAYVRVFLRQYQTAQPCPTCGGSRLRPEALWVRVDGRTIADVTRESIAAVRRWAAALPERLDARARQVTTVLLRHLQERLGFLDDIGLGYLTLDRPTRTLSGGEAQRLALANALGSHLTETLYVLDEPTIGLHPSDTERLLRLLRALRDRGNLVVMVEHDVDAIAAADYIVELGPGGGAEGGRLIFAGSASAFRQADTRTARHLTGRAPPLPPRPPRRFERWLRLRGARAHNLQGVDVELPLGALTAVTGVSGSGKSTLVIDVLLRALERRFLRGDTTARRHLGEIVGQWEALEGAEHLEGVVLVDQSPIGRTPRSNPATYTKAWDELRRLFAAQPEARRRGYSARTFSFNVPGGRCEACQGAGHRLVDMVFLPDVLLPCEVCQGTRFRAEVREIRLEGLAVDEVLALTVDEALRRFLRYDRLGRALWPLHEVGLGYLRLGQPAPTLSGGEAQRLKIARELAQGRRPSGCRLYVLDEPTTGLHPDDVRALLKILHGLVDAGHTVVVIEHNLELIAQADWVVDLGPGAGPEGGRVVAMGPPTEVAAHPVSRTGRWLATRWALATR
jgi:excinuclease ABC subunit A